MRSVSAAFKLKIKDPQRVEHVRGYVGTLPFTDANVLHMSYQNQCSDNKDVTFGSARIGQLTATLRGLNIARYSWSGKVIDLEYGLELDDEGTTEWVALGKFKIAKAEWTDTGINVTAYDCLADLDKTFMFTQTTGNIYDFGKLIERDTGVTFGLSGAECNDLPNGADFLGVFAENDIATYRDFASSIAAAVGGFATADENNNLVFRSFADSEVVDSFVSRDRIVGSVFSDYETTYKGIVINDMMSGTTVYYDATPSSLGAYISLGSNPLLQYGTTLVKDTQRQRIANVAGAIKYAPFSIAILDCPVYDLGDLITCVGGVAGASDLTCCVMSIEWTLKQTMTLKGFGADPNLIAGKSKTDKAISQLASKTSENELVIHTYENSKVYNLGENDRQNVIAIDFTTIKPTTVITLSEINIDLDVTSPSGKATAQVFYYLNGQLLAYQPVGTWSEDGKHIISLMYPLQSLGASAMYEWRVALEIDGGTATIDRGDIHATLYGQGLVALDQFDGSMTLIDTYTCSRSDKAFATWEDLCDCTEWNFDEPVVKDTFINATNEQGFMEWTGELVISQWLDYCHTLITESGDYLVTEDGEELLTEGERI